LDKVYGRQLVRETTNEFATGSLELSTSFAPFLVSNVPGSTIPIHRSLTSDGKGVGSPLPMICYYGGLSERFGTTIILDETATQRTVTAMAFFGLHENDDPDVTDNDLSFGVELPLYTIAVNPSNTLYIKYWAQYVTELYSSDARVVTCHVRLTEADLADLEFNDVIYIRDTAYRILTLSYDANTPSVAKAELLMKLDDVALCEDTPTFYWSSQNVILFNGSNPGAPDYGNKTCCEFYGYRWDPNKTTERVAARSIHNSKSNERPEAYHERNRPLTGLQGQGTPSVVACPCRLLSGLVVFGGLLWGVRLVS